MNRDAGKQKEVREMTREALLSPWKRPQAGWRTRLETTPGLGEKSRRSQGWVAATGALILFLLAPGPAHAQSGTYARLVGTVTDQTGAVLPGVEVTATARATNVPKMALTKGKSLDFRADLFNAFNHTIFFSPIGRMAFSSAGRVTQAASARQIQFGFRFSF